MTGPILSIHLFRLPVPLLIAGIAASIVHLDLGLGRSGILKSGLYHGNK